MYLLLFVFGGLLIAAGVALVGFGVSVQDHTFDPTVVTPGVVAIVGGLLLIGLGLALRALQRIERAVALRAAAQGTQLGDVALTTGPIAEAARIPLPPVPISRGQSAAAAPSTPMVKPDDATSRGLIVAPIETNQFVEQSEVILAPKPVVPPADEPAGESEHGRAAPKKNGATPPRIAPRIDVNARTAVASERGAGPAFDSLWPKVLPRSARVAQPVAAEPPAAVSSAEPAPAGVETALSAAPAPAAVQPVSVLKSGIVDGMAYTLYSDGSIEAQLPQGKLRFGSITDLRNHIEQSA